MKLFFIVASGDQRFDIRVFDVGFVLLSFIFSKALQRCLSEGRLLLCGC